MLNIHIRPSQSDNLKVYNLWDELVIYAPDQEQAISLNASAKAIWDLCDGQQTIAEMTETLGSQFNTSEADLLADIQATVDQFAELGLVKL
jgi:hypothetical protein